MPQSRLQRGEADRSSRNGSTFLRLADSGHSTSILGSPGVAAPSHMTLARAPVGSATSRSSLSRSGPEAVPSFPRSFPHYGIRIPKPLAIRG
ncbi:hypothetical protein BO85DRAFT_464460 [Aspergillus piperis CBS 112811]|uniref:Uncharacterized protein n=1 Tax=Aspergillus piperis CBS 112811 TaxID=1448313 RepID=A0A8G1VIJ3_9EURO|nr:hypothetical protein BO85DRAFT_464460 [Aspergillus piperis CBS 112811]RAH51773.1 hypothetical protein BO85DRAFT_464460 [Aspergillus piperis CBS 112811]